jgi:hypothetical protein
VSQHPLLWIDVVGYWIGIFLTLCVLSFLYKDNPFYKLAEHIFVGVSIGYVVTQQYYTVIRPNLIDKLGGIFDGHWGNLVYVIPLLFVILLLTKLGPPRIGWLGRYPLAYVVAFYAGLAVNALAQSDVAEQVSVSSRPITVAKVDVNSAGVDELAALPGMSPAVAQKVVAARDKGTEFKSLDDLSKVDGLTPAQREDLKNFRGHITGLDAKASVARGGWDLFAMFSRLLLLVGLISSLIYFYFSIEQKGVIGKVSRFGVWVLMIGFGASFGYTVQGRLSLAAGRAMDVMDLDKDASVGAQIHGPIVALVCLVLITGGIVAWEMWSRRPGRGAGGGPTDGGPSGGGEPPPEY